VSGLEEVAAQEIARRLGASSIRQLPRSLLFAIEDPMAAIELRTVDDVYLGGEHGFALGHTRSELRYLASAVRQVDVHAMVGVADASGQASSVEVTASFAGRRNYSRLDIEDAAGAALAHELGLPYVSRRAGPPIGTDALAWRVHLEPDSTLLGIRLVPRPLHRRPYKTATMPGTLHPPVAAALVWLADPRPGSRLLDPMCGAGTIVIEADLLHDRITVVGIDISRMILAAAAQNALAAGSQAKFARGDAAKMPIEDATFATVVTNPPWGRQVPAAGRLSGTLQPLWAETERVLEPGGTLAALTEGDGGVAARGLRLVGRHELSLMGVRSAITIMRKQ
jgi:tRNA (guanine6-N2)-methyltransferase